MTTLYHSPGSCSLGIHIMLEEIGKPYELARVNLQEGEQYQPAYLAVNPKSKVPALLRDDGSLLTEFTAIAYWLARSNPAAGLIADDIDTQARALEATDYVVATMHMGSFTRIFRPGNFSVRPEDHDAAKARGRELVDKAFAVMNTALEGRDYVTGAFSIADCALFYVEFWGAARMGIPLPANCAAHFARMKTRPSVIASLTQEGLPN